MLMDMENTQMTAKDLKVGDSAYYHDGGYPWSFTVTKITGKQVQIQHTSLRCGGRLKLDKPVFQTLDDAVDDVLRQEIEGHNARVAWIEGLRKREQ
jgi:hypothetical protein